MLSQVLNAVFVVAAGIFAALAMYWLLDRLFNLFPGDWPDRLRPFAYLLPAFSAITLYLLYPTVLTLYYSFMNASSKKFVGIDNYVTLFGQKAFQQAFINTLLWVLAVPAVTVAMGLAVAVLVDKLQPRSEKLAKTLIFMPMAISAVGAATVWRFMYASNPPTQDQVGLLNAIVTGFGGDPIAWMQQTTLHFNSFLLMVTFMWGQVGYAMVLLSAAVKAVPTDTLEAGRIDGANEPQIFRRIVVPQIMPTVITVFVTVTIGTMKVFDIVYVMTNGNFNTSVVGLEFFNQLFTNFNNGLASAIVVLLMVAIIPVMVYQVRHFRMEESS